MKIGVVNIMAKSDLKTQAEKMGLQVGRKIKVERVKREQWSTKKTKLWL